MSWSRSEAQIPFLPSTRHCVGAKPGQELKFEVSYPADFNEKRLAGKTIAYQIEVKGIKSEGPSRTE